MVISQISSMAHSVWPFVTLSHSSGFFLNKLSSRVRRIGSIALKGLACKKSRISLSISCDVNWDAFRVPGINGNRKTNDSVRQYDFLVIGSGIAGLTYALKVSEFGSVAVVTKGKVDDGCTRYAQGGICAVLDMSDSIENHISDTIIAGAFLNDKNAVEVVCREGPSLVLELASLGARFTRNPDGSLHLTKEGGHSNRRIVHAADATGDEIERLLVETICKRPNIDIFENCLAVDLVVEEASGAPHCFGADILDIASCKMKRFIALATMVCSGGAGHVYPNTTNPRVSTGDGIAMAHRAKAAVANMEFVQFHPTSLYSKDGESLRAQLISEAVRGEGGLLFNNKGERFMQSYDPRLELAPRDIVARAIHDQILKTGHPHVFLDISHKTPSEVLSHFPNIAKACVMHNIDITKEPIPVLPAQHYLCGGIQTGLLGETSIQGLYACGEVACTGLHGANRLASNSLLEGLVFSERAIGPSVAHAEHSLKHCGRQLHHAAASADFTGSCSASTLTDPDWQLVAIKRRQVQQLMWEHCGIVRSKQGLTKAAKDLLDLYFESLSLKQRLGVSAPVIELLNLVTVAELIVLSALQRQESRGLHYIVDYPELVEANCKPTVISGGFLEVDSESKKAAKTRRRSQSSVTTPTTAIKEGRKKRDFAVRSSSEE